MTTLIKKIQFLNKKEENELPLSDEEVIIMFIHKFFLPLIFFVFTTLIFSINPIVMSIAIIGLLLTEINAIKNLFLNNKNGTLYCPGIEEKKEKWNNEVNDKIYKFLKTPIEIEKKNNHPTAIQKSTYLKKDNNYKQPDAGTVLEQINIKPTLKEILKNKTQNYSSLF
ncbi:MAG: hypothetical protein LJI21_00660 [Wolbachia endosymbiont of Menacanthus eurysternus]|nr:MAG: hypothetical protein LJI21_00660 [Wolbachia endosymbiont of Menacanthus eurysternus]